MMIKGTIKSWNDERGFGFIEASQGEIDVFAHISDFQDRHIRPQANHEVYFELTLGPEGKRRAVNIQFNKPSSSAHPNTVEQAALWSTQSFLAIPVFVFLVGVVSLLWGPPVLLLSVYVVMSLVTYVTYAMDKSAARRGTWRTSENTLHLLSLLGGWPGALIGQQVLRHKSSKAPFRFVFWTTIVINVTLFFYLASPLSLRGF